MEDINVSPQANDIIMKATADAFRGQTLEAIGLKTPRIVDMLPTVLPTVEAKEQRVDFVFRLEDETLLHLEFQTRKLKDLFRFMMYGARLVDKYRKPVNTVVIYSGNVSDAPDVLKAGSLIYQVTNVYLRNLDGEAEYERLQAKLTVEGEIDETDMVRLIFLPLMKNEQPENEVVLAAAELAKGIKTHKQNFVLGSLIAISARYLNESDLARLMEVLKMTQIERMIMDKGRMEGEQAKAEAVAKAALKKGLSVKDVADITDLPLEKVKELQQEIEKEKVN